MFYKLPWTLYNVVLVNFTNDYQSEISGFMGVDLQINVGYSLVPKRIQTFTPMPELHERMYFESSREIYSDYRGSVFSIADLEAIGSYLNPTAQIGLYFLILFIIDKKELTMYLFQK